LSLADDRALSLNFILTKRFEMADSIEQLKQLATQRLSHLQSLIRPDLGSHKRIKLQRAGCGNSGSLLHDDVSAQHAKLLFDDYKNLFSEKANDQLRFITILHSVTSPTLESVIDAASRMEREINRAVGQAGVACLGATEIEVVNLKLLEKIKSLSDNEARKLNVLQNISDCSDVDPDCGVMIHFHGIVVSNSSLRNKELRSALTNVEDWARSPYQIELKNLFRNKTITQNLEKIASYVTKGGNENLRYNAGFGRDLPEDTDARIWRAGTGRADEGGETLTDERALTLHEIALLDRIWIALMSRRPDMRGYLIES